MSLIEYVLSEDSDIEITKETSTYIWIKCPICDGKLGISKRTSAYKCWTNECDSRRIYSLVTGRTYHPKPFVISEPINKVDVNSNVTFKKINSYKLPKTRTYYSPKFQEKVEETTYSYDSTNKVIRYNLLTTNKKVFTPYHWDVEKWNIGAHKYWPYYNEELIKLDGNAIFMAEGEKSADAICHTGLVCLSQPGFASQDWLEAAMRRIYPWLDGIIYWADNDETGRSKAEKIQYASWKAGLWCEVVNHDEVNDAADLEYSERVEWLNRLVKNYDS